MPSHTIINIHDYSQGIEAAAAYIHSKWGSKENYPFYLDAIKHSSTTEQNKIPQFYLMLENNQPIGCAALLTNDLISRQDLYPWVACLYIEESHRGKNLGVALCDHAIKCAKSAGFPNVYLTTDHDGYYEKSNWTRIQDGYPIFGSATSRIYTKTT